MTQKPATASVHYLPNNDPAEIVRNNRDYTIFPWAKQSAVNPINVERAEGVYLYDRAGKRYLDFSAQLANVNIGHGNRKVAEAVAKQMMEVSYVSPTTVATEARGLLGKKLAEIAPEGLTKTFFCMGGSDANETAIMLARLFTGKYKIISRYRSYHGGTNGAGSVSGDPRKHQFDLHTINHVVHVEDPFFYRCPWNTTSEEACRDAALAHTERVIQFEGPETIAAIFMEGESGFAGCIKYPKGYLAGIAALAKKYNILLIVDEVMSGFGRCGEWFACQREGVTPDILTMAKGLTSGYIPMGGVMVSEKIAAFLENTTLAYGLTYSAHPVACAAALANIAVYEEENLIENCRKMGAYLDSRLKELQKRHPSLGDVRMTGLLGAIELVKNKETKEPLAPWNAKPGELGVMPKVAAKMLELGVQIYWRWNMFMFAPPLGITKEQIDEGLAALDEALKIADAECH